MTTAVDGRRPPAGAPEPPRRARRGGPGPAERSGLWPLVFAGPLLLGVAVFYLWPIVQTASFSFTTFGAFGGQTWAGLDNYTRLLADPQLYRSLVNTLVYTAIVLLGVPLSVWLASLLNTPGLRFAAFYRVLFFLPYIAMPTAIALVWRIIYNGDFGILNYLLSLVGIDGPYWISTPGFALVAVSIVGLWSSLGFSMIVLAAGLKAIPPELYEAAELDGASPGRRFLSVTVPLLTPSIFFVTIVTVIGSFQLFDLLYAILGVNNPATEATESLVYYFYQAGFVQNQQGYAAAIAIVILVVIGVVTAVQFRLQRRWVNQ